MSADAPDPVLLSSVFLDSVRAHRPSDAVRRQAEAAGMDLDALREAEPLTYAAINAAALVRTDTRLLPQVSAAAARVSPHGQLFTVPLSVQQTDAELRIFPPPHRRELTLFDDELAQLVGTQAGGLFYRTVGDSGGERRELAWPVAPGAWREGAAFVGPFITEADATAWGQAHADPRAGFVFDTLPYAGAWFCDVFRGE